MCGIYGFQFVPGEELDMYQRLVIPMTLATEMESRGRDSFGGALWMPDVAAPIIIKDIGRVSENGADLMRRSIDASRLLGHTRAATTGSVCRANSHPFLEGDVLGVHNGIVYNHKALTEKYNRNLDVDSQHIFAHINENLDLEELDGYGAVVFARESEDFRRLWFGKTSSGSLTVARIYRDKTTWKEAEDGKPHIGILFASTYHAVASAAKRAGLDYNSINFKDSMLYYIEDGEVYKTDQPFGMRSHVTTVDTRTSGGHYGVHDSRYNNSTVTGSQYGMRGNTHSGNRSSASTVKQLSKRERRRLRKAFDRRLKEATKDKDKREQDRDNVLGFLTSNHHDFRPNLTNTPFSCDPFPVHIRDAKWLPKVYNGSAHPRYLCPKCEHCPMDDHTWGVCYSANSICMTQSTEACNNTVPICRDCGCYMLEGIHRETSGDGDTIYCITCASVCHTEEMKKLLREAALIVSDDADVEEQASQLSLVEQDTEDVDEVTEAELLPPQPRLPETATPTKPVSEVTAMVTRGTCGDRIIDMMLDGQFPATEN